jgi:DNA-directed RNA polymerase specialized sigma24 family protein
VESIDQVSDIEPLDYESFYRDAEPRLRLALTVALGTNLGAEAASSAMAYAFENWARVGAMMNPIGYLYRVGRSSARWRRKQLPPAVPMATESPQYEPELPKAINKLTSSQRSAVLLIDAWGFSYSEAAQVLEVSISTVRHHRDKGLDRLKQMMGVSHD